MTQNLSNEREYTISAARSTNATFIDLNLASTNYVNAIGSAASNRYNLASGDYTHLNDWGAAVFARMVVDLLLKESALAGVGSFITPNATMSDLIAAGKPA